jgi:homoserine O-acetyltransferase
MGISMGGMQTFQWLGQHPGFMDKAVPLDGSPKMTSYDLVVWQAHQQAIELLQARGATAAEIMGLIDSLGLITLWTPDWFVANVPPEQLAAFRAENASAEEPMDPNDYLAQLRAMIAHDAYADFAATEGGYPGRIAAEVLLVGVPGDHLVNPAPGKALAAAIGARYAEIHSNCGHIGTSCEAWQVEAIVNDFLAEK